MSIEVVKSGLLTTLQDTGRTGCAHLGVGRSGAFDNPALRIANALCGNPVDACALEITLLGPTLRFHSQAWIAVTGAPLPVRIDGREQPAWAPVSVPAGATLTLGTMRSGCRSHLAVHGGFDAEPVLGSRSLDVNAALGSQPARPLRIGDILSVAAPRGRLPDTPGWWLDARPWLDDDAVRTLRLLPGSQLERLTETSRNTLFSQTFKVQSDSNRTGLRLSGPKLEFDAHIEMTSEGCVPGLLQLPPSGQPILFGPEGPVSGGYPRLGQVAAVDMPRLAQLRPGDALRFAPCTFDEALTALRKREHALARLEAAIAKRLKA